MLGKCPGSDKRFLNSYIRKCPSCSYDVEIFSNEVKVECPRCSNDVYREDIPACMDWCKYAKNCLGTERYRELREKKEGRQPRKNT